MSAGTTHRATRENGPSVVDGRLVWTSATGITTADTGSYGGCLRKWFYDQVEDRKGPPTKAMLAGTGLHTEIENRLLTGASLQSPLALAGAHFLPHPGDSLFIEKPIHFTTRVGVSIYGHVDLYNLRGQFVDPNGDLQQDPPWSFEVKDWKTTADFQYAKTERELGENIQLTTYAEAGFRLWSDMDHARLTHVYFRTRGAPASKLVTIRRSREEIGARWEYAESVVRSMADVAGARSADAVPANTKACSAYNGCPHAKYCSAFGRTSLDNLFSKVVDDHLQEKQVGLGLIAQTQPQLLAQPVTQQQLAQEEQQMRAQVAQQQAQMPFNPADFIQVCTRLGTYGFGMPSLAGNAAQAYAAAGGQQVAPGFVFQGIMAPAGAQYSFHSMTLTEVAQVYQLEREAAAQRSPAPAPPPPPPPAPPPSFTQQLAQAYQAATPAQFGILPPGAPESIPQLAAAQPANTTAVAPLVAGGVGGATLAPEPAKKPGRPKKAQDVAPEAPAAVAAPAVPTQPASVPATQDPPAATSPTALTVVMINARSNGASRSLAGYVDYVNGDLAKRYCVTSDGKPGLQDVRCAPKDSPLAFGGWKGAVREVVKADPPKIDGDCHLDTFMDELNEAVADALRVVAEQKGWIYVRGVR